MTRRSILITVILVLVLIVGGVIGLTKHQNATKPATLSVSYNVADPTSAVTQLDGQAPQQVSSSGTTVSYQVSPGDHTLTVTLLGYKPFTAQFTAAPGDQVSIVAQLQLASDPTIHDASQIQGLGTGMTLSDIQYFYGQTWAVFRVSMPGTDPALAAAKYVPGANRWLLEAGPGTYFDPASDVENLPDQVASGLLNLQAQQDGGQ